MSSTETIHVTCPCCNGAKHVIVPTTIFTFTMPNTEKVAVKEVVDEATGRPLVVRRTVSPKDVKDYKKRGFTITEQNIPGKTHSKVLTIPTQELDDYQEAKAKAKRRGRAIPKKHFDRFHKNAWLTLRRAGQMRQYALHEEKTTEDRPGDAVCDHCGGTGKVETHPATPEELQTLLGK